MWLYCRILCLERIISVLLYTVEAQNILAIKSIPSGPTYVKLGENLTLDVTYNYTGTFGVRVTWAHGGINLVRKLADGRTINFNKRAFVKGEASLVLTNTERNDNGTYTVMAEADDVLKPTETINLIVIVQVQPTAVINCSADVTLKEGHDFQCLCISKVGNPPPTASWYKDGNLVSGPGYKKITLSLKNITGNNSGNYNCFVQSHDLNDTKSVEIEVLLKPTAVTNCSTSVTVKEGDDLVCLCYGTGGNPRPTASWYKDGRKVSGPEYLRKTLSLKSISKEDAGNYSCIVNNFAFEDVKQVQILVLHKPTAEINCSTPITVNETEEVECLCYGKGGYPPPTASWYKDGRKVNGSGDLKKILSLKNITKGGAGNYSCIVNNTVFKDVAQIEIQVRYKPEINYFGSDQKNNMATVGKSVKITCKADAFPPPDYKIFHNGAELTDVINGVKTIMSVNYNDAGQYKCTATNSRGNMFEIVNLTVKELKRPNASVNCSSPVTKNHGDEFVCLCVGDGGYPPPTASWFKDGKNVSGRGYLNKTLSLKNISKKDKGTYSCVVDSYGLNDTEEIEIQVQYKPEKISFESNQINNTVTVDKSITITCKADAFPSPNYTILHNGINLKDVVNGVKTFKSVKLSDNGSYICTAKNFLGKESEDFILTVKGSACASAPCFNGGTCKNEGEAFVCTCLPGYPGSQCQAQEKSKGADCTGFEWYIILVALVCGIIIGMIFHYGIMSLRRRFKSKKDNSKPSKNYDTPETHPEGAADNSAYQELDLRNKEPENSYQALRMNTRRRINNETKIEDEANYQELDKVREKENSYQSLNRV